ncbi:MAG: hypothetical protein KDE53_40240, partial [Caldilineaceae bacterium]|nr:hypothetical protein [Caldilineaceae bacterium]
PMSLDDDVFDAVYDYVNALTAMANSNPGLADLAGNYIRNHDKALRIAALLASLDGSKTISMRYWGRAREIAERWRQGLHNMYDTVSNNLESTDEGTRELVIAEQLRKYGPQTARQIHQSVRRKLSSAEVKGTLQGMIETNVVTEIAEGRQQRYVLTQDLDSPAGGAS